MYESQGLRDNFIGIRVLKLFKAWDDIMHVKAVWKLLNLNNLLSILVEPVEVLKVGQRAGHEEFRLFIRVLVSEIYLSLGNYLLLIYIFNNN